jgi:methyltransferase (TIGR00027 family)
MTRASPQLPTLIKARSMSVEHYLKGEGRLHAQVLVLGAGLDPKPLVFASHEQRWFLCDLRDMLSDRQTRLNSMGQENPHCINVPVDLRLPDWPATIRSAGFDPEQSTLVILEGVSMYLSARDLSRTLESIRELCGYRASRLWLDHVTETLLGMRRPEVQSFLSSMARLGEPFLTGISDPAEFFGNAAWRVVEHRSAAEILAIDEPVHHEYRFSLLSADLS